MGRTGHAVASSSKRSCPVIGSLRITITGVHTAASAGLLASRLSTTSMGTTNSGPFAARCVP